MVIPLSLAHTHKEYMKGHGKFYIVADVLSLTLYTFVGRLLVG